MDIVGSIQRSSGCDLYGVFLSCCDRHLKQVGLQRKFQFNQAIIYRIESSRNSPYFRRIQFLYVEPELAGHPLWFAFGSIFRFL